jgi:hypothetical protein
MAWTLMKKSAAAQGGVLESMKSPWALLPAALGISLLIVAGAFLPDYWKPLGLVAAGCFLLTLVILSILVLMAPSENPEHARTRKEFLDRLEEVCSKSMQASRESERGGTVAQVEPT